MIMSEIQLSCWNSTYDLLNTSWTAGYHYQVSNAAETIILPSFIGIICATGLVGNILVLVIIIRSRRKTIPDIYICNLAVADLVHVVGMPFLIHQWARSGEWVFGSPLCTIITSLDTCNQFACSAIMTAMSLDRYTLYLTITTFFFPLPLILTCYILILCYTWEMYQQNKKAGRYNTSIPRERILRLTRMVLVLVGVFIVSSAPYHVIQLVNLQISQPTLTFYVCYYCSICLSYASSSVNPFLYVLLSGNFRKRLSACTKVKMKTTEREINNIENTLKSSF
ncbi:melanin-concentrating hormone receptor 2 isoform X2 [Microcaecilia unicolor]|uniref:Melanin-concentrating hormone receptor 2 isoform X2 n=1 Tax=Microcaecilia unicolor TaxID=1415580 RepID=A0A6P7XGC0_9AMPH|nr:melanin-concentrating hormone receptor 2 isoform X2 [Microcaecilia unicolor]